MPRPVFDRPIAHRGLHDRAAGVIENSASAFEAAIAGGYHIECDLQLTSDGVPVVFHDPALQRLTGRDGRVSDLTAAQMTGLPLLESAAGDRPQTFADMLRQVDGRTLLQVELKRQPPGPAGPTLARKAAEAVAAYRGPIVFESFDPTLIADLHRFGFSGARGIITKAYDRPDGDPDLSAAQRFFMRHLLHFPVTRFDFISCEWDCVDLPAVRMFRALGKPVTAWTIRTPQSVDKVAAHVDQIVFEGFTPSRA
jgi:glycerophosphoryl diester phosphodiesterase